MGTNSMNAAIEVKQTDDGAILARRLDGKPLTTTDREAAKREASKRTICNDNQRPAVEQIIDDNTVAVLIDSSILGAPIWFALRDSWQLDEPNRIPIFYASELPALRQKTVEQLRAIYITKLAFGAGRLKQ